MLKDVYYFSDERGRFPVEEYLRGLPPDEKKKAYAYIAALWALGHAIRKRGDKLPEKDIRLALKRKAQAEAERRTGKLAREEL